MEIKVLAPAKINLTLDVTGKRPDGYHNILSIMQSVDLYDTITVTDNDSGQITVSCNYEGVPCDEKNICYKAAERFFIATRNEGKGVHIDIDKVIDSERGMIRQAHNTQFLEDRQKVIDDLNHLVIFFDFRILFLRFVSLLIL